MDGQDEKELLSRLSQGDTAAFYLIYQRYNDRIFSAAMLYVKDWHRAREIVQQVFLKIWEKRASMEGIGNFQDYIIVISRNLIYDMFRRKNMGAKKIADPAERSADPSLHSSSGLAEQHDYDQVLKAAIQLLPPQQRIIYLLIHEEKVSYEKVAERLGLSKFLVERHLELARRFVGSYVTQYLGHR